MKTFTVCNLILTCVLALFMAASVVASEVQLDFTVVGTVNIADKTMNTTIDQMTGYIVWSTNKAPSHEFHKISGLVASGLGPVDPYWLVIGMPTYLTITFPEPIYISKIVTYNIGMTTAWGTGPSAGDRWSESSLWVTSEGTDYDMGDIRVDDTPSVTDYVELSIDKTITEITYLFENIHSPDYNYYAVNRIYIYTTAPDFSSAIPEPATVVMGLVSLLGISFRKLRKS